VIGLQDNPIWRILTSPTLRCHQTVQPHARDIRLRIERESALSVDVDLARVLALLEDPRMQDTVMCTHGEGIGHVLTRLVTDGLAVDQPLQWPKGRPGCCTTPTTTHPRPLPATAGPGPCPEQSIGTAGRGPAPDANSRPGVGITAILERPIPP
jgi:hypothetical protein